MLVCGRGTRRAGSARQKPPKTRQVTRGSSGKDAPLGAADDPPRRTFINMKTNTPPVCDYTASRYQKSFWDEGSRAYEDTAEEITLRRILPPRGDFYWNSAQPNADTPRYAGTDRVVLVDYSTTQLERPKERLGRSNQYVYIQ